jgi:hypothetical protein
MGNGKYPQYPIPALLAFCTLILASASLRLTSQIRSETVQRSEHAGRNHRHLINQTFTR